MVLKLTSNFTAEDAVEYDTSSRFNAVRLFDISSQRFMIFHDSKKKEVLSSVGTRPPQTKTTVCGPCICPPVHVDNGLKFGLRPSIRFGRWTKIIILRWASGRFLDHGPSDSRTDSDAFCGYRNKASVLAFSTILLDLNFTADFEHLKGFSSVGT